jgi:hypothetical protein
MDLGKWNVGVLSTGCVVIGMMLGFIFGGLLAPPIADEPWLKTYQGLAGALVGLSAAGLGLAVATRNVLRQLRVNLMSREEDRMERDLSSLKRVSATLGHLSEVLRLSPNEGIFILQNLESFLPGGSSPKDYSEAQNDAGVLLHNLANPSANSASLKERVQKKFADADDLVQDEIVLIYVQLRNWAMAVASLERKAGDDQVARPNAKLTEAKHGFAHWHGRLEQLERRISQRAAMYERRLPQFRAEIERFFWQ